MIDLYERTVSLMADLHPALWVHASWQAGEALRGEIFEVRNLAGLLAYDPETNRLNGWVVNWVDGSDLRIGVGQDRLSPAEFLCMTPEQYGALVARFKAA